MFVLTVLTWLFYQNIWFYLSTPLHNFKEFCICQKKIIPWVPISLNVISDCQCFESQCIFWIFYEQISGYVLIFLKGFSSLSKIQQIITFQELGCVLGYLVLILAAFLWHVGGGDSQAYVIILLSSEEYCSRHFLSEFRITFCPSYIFQYLVFQFFLTFPQLTYSSISFVPWLSLTWFLQEV